MKNLNTIIIFLILPFALSFGSGDSINQDWYSQVLENIKKQEYNITYSKNFEAFQAPNRENNLRFIYKVNGFIVSPRVTERLRIDENDPSSKREIINVTDEWKAEFTLLGYGRNGSIEKRFSGSELIVENNATYTEDENMKIEYLNNEKGMRQDFTIYNKPQNDKGLLTLSLEVKTEENLLVGADALVIKSNSAKEYMRYNSLKIWDAKGNILRGWFENVKNNVNEEIKIIQIVVNDEDAKYPIIIDPLSNNSNWRVENTGNFGSSVAAAGDINGDGFGDIIVGAWQFTNGESNEGAAFLFLGSATGPLTTSDWSFEANVPFESLGYSVSTAGDINGDGFSDVIVGSRSSSFGTAYVFHGSATGLSTTPDWSADGTNFIEYFGESVSTAGDVNGDGFSDIIVGGSGYDVINAEGKISVFYGSSSGLSSAADWTKIGQQAGIELGQVVCTAGDVNGDGFSDIIASKNNVVYAYYGSSTGLPSTESWTVSGFQGASLFGSSISTAGDINGDGYSDVIVGARRYVLGSDELGAAFIYYGSSSGLSLSTNKTIYGEQVEAAFGEKVSTAGDINDDGFADILIGASSYDNSTADAGKIYVYYGSGSGISDIADWTKDGDPSIQLALGKSVAVAGDVNGDGFSDIIAGESGAAIVYLGSAATLSNSLNWATESNQANANLGNSISTAGDVNGDGFSDIIIGAENYDNGESNEGKVFVYHGSSSGLSLTADWSTEGNQDGAHFGSSVSTAGDVNGDGFDDVIIGAKDYSDLESNEGAAFVYHGSSTGLSLTEDWSTQSNQTNAYLGSSVSTAGDVNGDGFSDVIIASNYYDSGEINEGRVFIHFGSSSGLSTNYDWSAEGNQGVALFGSSVSTAGDVNGDGYSDVIVGSDNYDNGEIDEGAAFVYHGSPNGPSITSDWSFESNQANAYLGNSVSTAGDINGDGFSDIILGAYFFSNGQVDEGKVIVFYGSANGLSITEDWSTESDQVNAHFGNSVSTAGDVNGDGYSDVIIGDSDYSNDQTDEGKVFVYHGSSNGLSLSESWSIEGNIFNGHLGNDVSTAGDINGDGYSDIIIASSEYNNGQTNEGNVSLYFGNGGNGLDSRTRQNNPSTGSRLAAGNLTDSDGEIEIGHRIKSPFGRADGRMTYEFRRNGEAFSSGDSITNSVNYDGTTTFEDLMTNPNGKGIFTSVSGLQSSYSDAYQWRARKEFSLVNNPYQKYSPWKYYSAYSPIQPYAFRPRVFIPLNIIAQIKVLLEGPYNEIDNMKTTLNTNIPLDSPYSEDPRTASSIPSNAVDWILVELRDKNDNTKVLVSKSAFLLQDKTIRELNGSSPLSFTLPADDYYIVIKHRNHLPIMSANPVSLTAN